MLNRHLVRALFILIPLAGAIEAQEGRGTITGRVVDSSGATVAGVEVRVTNAETGATASARSNESGNYTVLYLLPGAYNLTAEFAGFKKMEKRGIEIRVQ